MCRVLFIIIYLTLFNFAPAKRRKLKRCKIEETYIYKGREILLRNEEVKWYRAKLYCAARFGGELIMPKTKDLAIFLANILEESNMDLDNMWIGLKKSGWIDGTSLDKKSDINKFFLIRNPNETIPDVRDCYSFTRFDHDTPAFVDLNCQVPRGFVCIREQWRIVMRSHRAMEPSHHHQRPRNKKNTNDLKKYFKVL